MSHTLRRRTRHRRLTLAALAGAGLLALAGCGTEQESSAGSSTEDAAPRSPSTSVPVVGGPSPRSATTTDAHTTSDDTSSEAGDTSCGSIPGPDGALRILILAGDVTCSTAEEIAADYGPKIATGQQQSVSGWTCGPSEVEGVLAACQSGDKVIGFTP